MGNWLSSLFGGSSANAPKKSIKYSNLVTSTDEALLQVKLARDKIHRERKKNDQIVGILREKARQALANNKKEQAKLILRRRKYLTKRMKQLEAQLFNLEEMIDKIEEKAIEKQVFDGLREGTDELQRIQQDLTVEKIEQLMEDSREAMDRQNEISEALSQLLNVEDEEDVEASLQELENSLLQEQLNEVKVTKEKHAPKTKEPVEEEEEDAESEEAETTSPAERVAVAV